MSKLDDIARHAYSTRETVQNTYDLAKAALPGVFVECGVASGAQIMAMRLADELRTIYAFDSFEGIPLAGPNDEQQPGIGEIKHDVNVPVRDRLVSSGITSHSLEDVKRCFKHNGVSTDNIICVQGWFQDTLPVTYVPPIALLRLDGDLYESTMVCLEHLYDKVVKGGVIIIDDYALPGCRKAVTDYLGYTPEVREVEGGMGVVYFYKK